jgi:hypothetical protein
MPFPKSVLIEKSYMDFFHKKKEKKPQYNTIERIDRLRNFLYFIYYLILS